MSQTSDKPSEIPYKAELLRKSLHLLALVIPFGAYLAGKEIALAVLIPGCIIAILTEWARVRYTFVAKWVHRVFGFMMRTSEIPEIGSPIVLNGATWVLLSATCLLLLFPVTVGVPVLVMFMVADAAAALIGRPFGKHHWGKLSKSVEGSIAFFVTAIVILMAFDQWTWSICLAVALCATLLEILPLPINDNLHVPVFSAALLVAFETLL